MKKRSTGMRLLAFVCALVMTLGVGLQGNVITARAYDFPVWETGVDEEGNAVLRWDHNNTTTSYEESEASFRKGWLALGWNKEDMERIIEEDKQRFIKAGALSLTPPEPPEPPKSQAEIVTEKAEKELTVVHPLSNTTGTPLRVVNTGEYNSYKKDFMQKVSKQLADGNNVVFFNRYNKKDHIVLIPAGTVLDPNIEWFGPEYMSANFVDITEEYKAQDPSLSQFMKIKNILDARAAAGK